MLVLTRKVGESIVIGDGITVRVLEVGGRVRLGIDAPRDVSITRPDASTKPAEDCSAEPAASRSGVADRMRSRSRQETVAPDVRHAPSTRSGRTGAGVPVHSMLE